MWLILHNIMLLHECHNMVSYQWFHHLAHNRPQTDRSVVSRFYWASLFEDLCDLCYFPTIRNIPLIYWLSEDKIWQVVEQSHVKLPLRPSDASRQDLVIYLDLTFVVASTTLLSEGYIKEFLSIIHDIWFWYMYICEILFGKHTCKEGLRICLVTICMHIPPIFF